ncbi:MAG: hypothetical protein KBS66_07500 [Eubacterium sp.]|nr:hypothetical protein [Candidatus Colimonas fimequi]
MKRLKCECCGGNLRENPLAHYSYVCEYCGTMYKEEHEYVHRVETFQSPVRIYQAEAMIDRQIYESCPQDVSGYAIKRLAHELAETIAENMELDTGYDPRRNCHRVRARVRIVPPGHLF